MANEHHGDKPEMLMLAEMQVVLAELRTHLSILRTGVALLVSSLSASFLIIANETLIPTRFTQFSLEVKFILGLIAVIGLWRFLDAENKIRKLHVIIRKLEERSSSLREVMVI